MSRITFLAVACLLAAACGPKTADVKPVVTQPEVVEVKVKEYVKIKPELTAPVPDPTPGPYAKGKDIVDSNDARGKALQQCNGQLQDIAGVQGTKPC